MYNNMFFQESCSLGMFLLSSFHDFSLAVILFILTFVGGLTYSVVYNNHISSDSVGVTMEVVWTVIPMFILGILALPSLKILYFLEESNPVFTFKALGHQWYWSYEVSELESSGSGVAFNSYMANNKEEYRLLDVDARMVLPHSKDIRGLISSSDVLHCWTVPSLGVKADAVPGRLNQLLFNVMRPSILYGQCSEICGANHSFMPIVVECMDYDSFLGWLSE
uniref:cytochrome c oxidase subunit 2 n=1 Tax=Membranipora villosa TaxID=2857147 RepID=UPI002E78C5DE|nr:cytochrome c oxidase subunit 2 [Membranipora villosa]WQB41566.1 cytochrome c oxidase subunit 2 [Membranipora villosa]